MAEATFGSDRVDWLAADDYGLLRDPIEESHRVFGDNCRTESPCSFHLENMPPKRKEHGEKKINRAKLFKWTPSLPECTATRDCACAVAFRACAPTIVQHHI